MKPIFADYSASISELKANPSALITNANGSAIAILNHNTPTAYLVPAETYESMTEAIDDIELRNIIAQRLQDTDKAIEVNLEDL